MKHLQHSINLSGTVIPGEKIGRKINFPTANLSLTKKPSIKPGVYVALCYLTTKSYLGLAYYGKRYIFNQSQNSFEVYLFDLNQNIYGRVLKVKLTHWLRPPLKLTSLKKLQTQLEKDQAGLNQTVVLVDKTDQLLGLETKVKAHQGGGKLHRAISVFLFNSKGELLIQQRSRFKTLWPLVWANTCCSHPQIGESYQKAAQRRLYQEFGIKAKLRLHHQFIYQAKYRHLGSEYEHDAVFLGVSNQPPKPDKQEIKAWQYISLKTLRADIKAHPDQYGPWLKLIVKKIRPSDIFNS